MIYVIDWLSYRISSENWKSLGSSAEVVTESNQKWHKFQFCKCSGWLMAAWILQLPPLASSGFLHDQIKWTLRERGPTMSVKTMAGWDAGD